VLSPLTTDHVKQILKRAHKALCEDKGVQDIVSDELIDYLADLADGDGSLLQVSNVDCSSKRTEHVRFDILSRFNCKSKERSSNSGEITTITAPNTNRL
jgi:replication-associated recombination protein RarA